VHSDKQHQHEHIFTLVTLCTVLSYFHAGRPLAWLGVAADRGRVWPEIFASGAKRLGGVGHDCSSSPSSLRQFEPSSPRKTSNSSFAGCLGEERGEYSTTPRSSAHTSSLESLSIPGLLVPLLAPPSPELTVASPPGDGVAGWKVEPILSEFNYASSHV
jgi:hypothetical protein